MRLQVQAPIFGNVTTNWIWGCVAPGVSTLPPVDSEVWIMFQQGDQDYPVWIGMAPFGGPTPEGPVAGRSDSYSEASLT